MLIELSTINVVTVHSFFNDEKKTSFWLQTKNLNFGGASPAMLMNSGRSKKLLKWIEMRLDENRTLASHEKG